MLTSSLSCPFAFATGAKSFFGFRPGLGLEGITHSLEAIVVVEYGSSKRQRR